MASSPDILGASPPEAQESFRNAPPSKSKSSLLIVASEPQQPSIEALHFFETLGEPTKTLTWLLTFFEESQTHTFPQKLLYRAFEDTFGRGNCLSPIQLLQAVKAAFPTSQLHREDFGGGLYVVQGLADRKQDSLEYNGQRTGLDEALDGKVAERVAFFEIGVDVLEDMVDPVLRDPAVARRGQTMTTPVDGQLKTESTTTMNEQIPTTNARDLTTADLVNEIYDTIVLEKFPIFIDGPANDLEPITDSPSKAPLQEKSVNIAIKAAPGDGPVHVEPRELIRDIQSSPVAAYNEHLDETLDLSSDDSTGAEGSSENGEPAAEDVTGNTTVEPVAEIALVNKSPITRLSKPQVSFHLPSDRQVLTTFDFHPLHVAAIAKAAPLGTKSLFNKRKITVVTREPPDVNMTNANANPALPEPPPALKEMATTSVSRVDADSAALESPLGPALDPASTPAPNPAPNPAPDSTPDSASDPTAISAPDPVVNSNPDGLADGNSLDADAASTRNVQTPIQGDLPSSEAEPDASNASYESSPNLTPELALVDGFRGSSLEPTPEVDMLNRSQSSSLETDQVPSALKGVYAISPESAPAAAVADGPRRSSPEIPTGNDPHRLTTYASRKRVRIQELPRREIASHPRDRKTGLIIKKWGVGLYTRRPPASDPVEPDEDTIRVVPPLKRIRTSTSEVHTNIIKYDGPRPRVTFTLTNIVDNQNAISFLRKQGGCVNGTVARANIVCVGEGQLRKTSKLLLGIVQGRTLVTDRWLKESVQAGFLINPEPFFPHEPAREKEWDISLREAVEAGPTLKTLLRGKTITLTTSFRETLGDLLEEYKLLVKAVGAKNIVESFPPRSARRQSYLIIGTENDREDHLNVRSGKPIWSRDMLPMSVLRGELQVGDKFQICGSTEESFGEGEL